MWRPLKAVVAAVVLLVDATLGYGRTTDGPAGRPVVLKLRTDVRVRRHLVNDAAKRSRSSGGRPAVFRAHRTAEGGRRWLWLVTLKDDSPRKLETSADLAMLRDLPAGTRSSDSGAVQSYDDHNKKGDVWYEKGRFDEAIAEYTEAIRIRPKDSIVPRTNRGVAWLNKGEYDNALADFDELIRISPKDVIAHNNRGRVWLRKGAYDTALAAFDEAIRIRPSYALAYANRGETWSEKGAYAKALADYNKAIRLDPKSSLAYTNRAWLWATCPDDRFRDGKAAVESASYACKLSGWKDEDCVATLAAAHAETGDFEAAVKWQYVAQGLYTAEKDRLAGWDRLSLYRKQKPYRQKARPGD